MALSRWFLNLMVDSRTPRAKSLHCLDLAHHSLFSRTSPRPLKGKGSEFGGRQDATTWAPAADAGNRKKKQTADMALKMESFQLPSPIFNFRASCSDENDDWRIHCFPLADRRMICADQMGRSFLFEADTTFLGTMPRLQEPKLAPISLFIPRSVNADGGGLFVMERAPKPGAGNQFDAFFYRMPESTSRAAYWDSELLPSPSYVSDPTYSQVCPEINSYAVVDGGTRICISVKGIGTYCLDLMSRTWSQVGKWTLPFHGKVEFVPELKLWFGFSDKAQVLAAADLSSLDSRPQLVVAASMELDPPEEWSQCKDSQLVNFGSGKFIIARFFHTRTPNRSCGNELIEQILTVLTGVEVAPYDASGDVKGKSIRFGLRMIPRKSRCHISDGSSTIETVF